MSKSTYGNLLSGALKEFVTGQLAKPAESQVEVFEELALHRATAAQAVEVYSKAADKLSQLRENPNASADEKQAAFQMQYQTAEMMKRELLSVAALAKTASQIQSTQTNQLSLSAMEAIISNIIDLIYDALRPETNGLQIAARIEKKISSQISVNLDRGTVLLPSDELVQSMDLTVVGAAEGEELD